MSEIVFSSVSKVYGDKTVLDDISFAVEKGDFVTVIGRSGCGKTTLLKLVNALVEPSSGEIEVAGVSLKTVDCVQLRRTIGYSIQSVGLFPHMTIEENIAYVPMISHLEGWDKKERRDKVVNLLESVGLEADCLKRYPRTLSGGQRQRVGIARSLAADPSILLMDEPFGAVDEITREQLQELLLSIHKKRKITVLFVTHDICEALMLSTRVMVLNEGRIEQFDRPSAIVDTPASDFVHNLVEKSRTFTIRV